MPLNPPPTIENGLGLISQQLLRSDMTRAAEVTFAITASGVMGPSVAQDSIDDFQANFNATFGSVMDGQVLVLAPTIRLGDGSDIPFEATASGVVINGGSPGTFMPPSVALLLKKTSGIAGKTHRGRSYFPFMLPTSVVSENGTVDPTEVNAINTIAATFLAQLVTDVIPLVIPNKVFNTPLPPHHVTAINTGPLVAQYLAESKIATQRRRLDR
jgi:hypothetical protein